MSPSITCPILWPRSPWRTSWRACWGLRPGRKPSEASPTSCSSIASSSLATACRHARVLQGREPQRSARAPAFGEQAAHDRLRTVRVVDAFLVSGLQGACQVLLVQAPRDPVHARGAARVAASEGVCPHRHLQRVGERGARHVGIPTCRSGEPFQSPQDRLRARSPWALSCRGSERTPGVAFAAPGPTDGGGALASRSRGCLRPRVSRRALSGDRLVCGCCGRWYDHRSSAPRRLPHAHPAIRRVPARPSVPVVPAFCWMERPGGAAGLSRGSCGPAVDSPRRVHLRAVPRCLDRRRRRRSRVPVFSLWQHDRVSDPGGLRLVSPVTTGRIRRSSALTLSALPTPEAQGSWGVVIPCGTTTCTQLSRRHTDPAAWRHPASDVCLRPPAGFAPGLVARRCPWEDVHLLENFT